MSPAALRDSATMLRRDLRHAQRFPMLTASGIGVPVIFLLLFAGVFGRALSAGLGVRPGGYVDYLTPGILVMTAGFAAESTAVSVSTDFRLGIIDRFRTMPIARTSVLTGTVAGSVIRTMLSGVLVVAVALALGFRSAAGPAGWIAAAGLFALLALALTWLTVALGLFAKTPPGANGLALLVAILPFVSSAFVPTAAMPAGVRWFAENQPFTPVIDTMRGLLTGGAIGTSAILAVAWCAGIALAGYLWARASYHRGPAAAPAAAGLPWRHDTERAGQRASMKPPGLTIGQLAAHAGVTVRAVRHYHRRGLLAEPARDASGYRRYDAQAVVDLIRIKTLADAGVPLARVQELLGAGPAEFAAAIAEIDQGLRDKIRDLTRHRRRIAELAAGERLFLPAEVVEMLDELRALGVSERGVRNERDGWILVAALSPQLIPSWAGHKRAALADPEFRQLYLACDEAFDWDPDDPRLEKLAGWIVGGPSATDPTAIRPGSTCRPPSPC